MANLKLLVNSRKYLRKLVTESHNELSSLRDLSVQDKLAKKASFIDYTSRLNKLNDEIQQAKFTNEADDNELVLELENCEAYANKLRACIAQVEIVTSRNSLNNEHSLLRSPKAPLPSFTSAPDEDLTKFLLLFETTTEKFNLSDYDKYLLLRQQVSGRASILLNSLDVNNQSYKAAEKLLTEALASPVTKKFAVVKQLVELKMTESTDPFEYVMHPRRAMRRTIITKILNINYILIKC